MIRPLDVVSGAYEAFGAGDLAAFAEFLDPAVVFVTLDLTFRPRRLEGREAAIGFIEEVTGPLAEFRMIVKEATEVGRHVVTSVDHRGRTGPETSETSSVLCHLWRVEGSRLASFRLYLDHSRALRSAAARDTVRGRSMEAV